MAKQNTHTVRAARHDRNGVNPDMGRKRFEEMTVAELEAYEQTSNYSIGRADAFDHGAPATVLEYWGTKDPSYEELLVIVKNILKR